MLSIDALTPNIAQQSRLVGMCIGYTKRCYQPPDHHLCKSGRSCDHQPTTITTSHDMLWILHDQKWLQYTCKYIIGILDFFDQTLQLPFVLPLTFCASIYLFFGKPADIDCWIRYVLVIQWWLLDAISSTQSLSACLIRGSKSHNTPNPSASFLPSSAVIHTTYTISGWHLFEEIWYRTVTDLNRNWPHYCVESPLLRMGPAHAESRREVSPKAVIERLQLLPDMFPW